MNLDPRVARTVQCTEMRYHTGRCRSRPEDLEDWEASANMAYLRCDYEFIPALTRFSNLPEYEDRDE
jgi:hypothetical protein